MDATYMDSLKAFVDRQQEIFNNGINAGKFQPWVFPRDFVSIPIIVIALLIKWPRDGPIKYLKHLLYFYSLYSNIYAIFHCRSLAILGGYGIGLIFSWFSIWSAALLLFNDVQENYKRIERSFEPLEAERQDLPNGKNENHMGSVRLRSPQNQRTSTLELSSDGKIGYNPKVVRRFRWQGYPESLGHRFAWVFDLLISQRGPHWNWRAKDFPALPKNIQLQLDHGERAKPSDDLLWEEDTRAHLKASFCRMLVYYLCLDFLKVIVIGDPYFLGYLDSPPPSFFDFCGILAPIVAHIYRLILTTAAVFFSVVFPASLITTIFLAISLTPLRFWTRIPFEASFLYPPYFGNILTSTLDGGLIGLWGTCWHKQFRAGFLAPGNWIKPVSVSTPTGGEQRSSMFWCLHVIISFTLSGIVHAAGSYTQVTPTNPSGQFLFFISQMFRNG
ncbi:uncharacterized protein GIQ15_05166 [Arthroderma uncinatum]|uniref:uncharacterized protein n=1 Tax=Arthroderma uncinatum TaxID=74035 RepID=UPI00144ACF77|nr:uncharacterized protein GIQ15_05166 [Arthroderma uncinatum]KAF3482407.1 hypothetical protein GIQ15_05166 [Arthroderma uncinatum]